MDDRLPQNICHNCLNNINNSITFRKQCIEAEKQLLIMKRKFENNKCNIKEMEPEMVVTENTKIKDEGVQTLENTQVEGENSCNDKNSQMIYLTKDLISVIGTSKQIDHFEMKTVLCKLCQKAVVSRKYLTHMATKHNPTVDKTVMCNICHIYFNKKQLIKHIKSAHTKSRHTENINNDSNAFNKSTNDNTLISKSLNSEDKNFRDKRQIESIGDSELNKFTSKNNSNNSSLLNKSVNSTSENFSNEKQNNDIILINKLLNGEVEHTTSINEKQLKSEPDEIHATENVLYNYNDTVSKRVTCKLCQKDLSIRSVDSHMARHHPGADKRRVKCDLCGNYVLKSKLNRHIVLMHDSGYICRYCKCKFDSKEELVEHVGSCSAKKKRRICDSSRELRECDECHKMMQKGSLRLHKAIKHKGLRPVCEHCGRHFGNKLRLHDHYRAKHGYEKFRCSYCDFQSACNTSMRNHERRHRGEKPFVCEACGAGFHAAYLLAQHRQSHAVGKAFQCDLCPASFKVNNTLHMHKRSCHGTSKYACTMCARTFSTRHYVVKHLRAVHRFTGPVPPMAPIE